MKKGYIIAIMILLAYSVLGCKGDLEDAGYAADGLLSGEKDFASFSFKAENNKVENDEDKGIKEDVICEINGTSIACEIPYSADNSSLIASFDALANNITIDGVEQVSDLTANNFERPLTYEVYAEDGTIREYKVTVFKGPSDEKDFTFARILKEDNSSKSPSLFRDSHGEIDTDAAEVTITVPFQGWLMNKTTNPGVTCSTPQVGDYCYSGTAADYPLCEKNSAGDCIVPDLEDYLMEFSITGAKAEFNGTLQEVGSETENGVKIFNVTRNTFKANSYNEDTKTWPKTNYNLYTLTADDESTKDYKVYFNQMPSPARRILYYAFRVEDNDGLSIDVTGSIVGDPDADFPDTVYSEAANLYPYITVELPVGTNVSSLVAFFRNSGGVVSILNDEQISGTTANDFSTEIVYKSWAKCDSDNWPTQGSTYGDYEYYAMVYTIPMVPVQGGTYTAANCSVCSGNVTINDLYAGKYEITGTQWYDVKGWALTNGYTFSGNEILGKDGTTGNMELPITSENVNDFIVWCNALSETEGFTPVYYTDSGKVTVHRDATDADIDAYFDEAANGYRLPTEAEWEYIAENKGTATNIDFSGHDGSNAIGDYTWYSVNSGGDAHDKGTKNGAVLNLTSLGGNTVVINDFKVYDMSGNVREWCFDWYDTTLDVGGVNTYEDTKSARRVYRGGDWNSEATDCTTHARGSYNFYLDYNFPGFRVVRNR